MNSTNPILPVGPAAAGDLGPTLAAAFFGFSAGAILYGITIRQAFQYYTTCIQDSNWRKSVIAIVCLLDTVHLIFSMSLVYTLILQLIGFPSGGPSTLSLKALGSTQTFLILFVQGFYLSQIWKLSDNLQFLTRRFSHAVHIFVIFVAIFAIAVAIVFLSQLVKIDSAFNFSAGFEYVVYLGFGATAIIDCAIAAAMCLMLNKGSGGLKTESIVESLIQYFIGSGLITSFAAILCITLYVAQPDTLLYLGMELSVTRLYANSMLAMFNARWQLRKRLDDNTIDLNQVSVHSFINFRHPERTPQTISLLSPTASSPFSPGQETKYSEASDYEAYMKGVKDGSDISRDSTL